MIAELKRLPEVEYAEPNRIHHTVFTPNDPYYASSGAWHQTFRDLWGLQSIAASTAWDQTKGSGVVVGIVDTGIDYTHPDIASNIWENPGELGLDSLGRDKRFNGIDDDNDGYIDDWRGVNFVSSGSPEAQNDPMDDFGHGTHVAGTVAAVGNNGIGVVGVAMAAQVMALKGLDQNGSGTDADLATAITYAADHGASVINASWGGVSSTGPDMTLLDAINFAHDQKDVVFVAAAGNESADIGGQWGTGAGFYPAAADNVIAVSAVNHLDALAYFSNVGLKLDVAAPGGGDTDSTGTVQFPERSVLSLLSSKASSAMTNNGAFVVGTNYLRQAGTSMATPHVTGVAALVRALHPTLSAEQVRQALRAGSDDLFTAGFDTQAGYGRANATKALAQASPLTVHLTGPFSVNGLAQVAITGSAFGPSFAGYTLEYGLGEMPTTFTAIGSFNAPVTSGTLATWTLSGIDDGLYTLHLTAHTTGGQTFEDRIGIVFQNVVISSPVSQETYRSGLSVPLVGTVSSPDLSKFTVSVVGSKTGTLNNPNITLTNGGTQPVSNGTLATWNTTGVAADHYNLVLTVTVTGGATRVRQTSIIVDPTVHSGFPWWFGNAGDGAGVSDPVYGITAADFDGSGASSIVIHQGQAVYIVRGDGMLRPGWPQNIDAFDGNFAMTPVVGDITGDGVPEIVQAADTGTLSVWEPNGTALAGWPVKQPTSGFQYFVTLADINGDGVRDVVVVDEFNGIVRVFNHTGTMLPGFSIALGQALNYAAVADVDGDGQNEIVVASLDGAKLWVIASNGTTKSGWPKQISKGPSPNGLAWSLPALADLDGDGKPDIVIGTNDGTLLALHGDGTAVAGFPQSTALAQVNSPAIGDIDGDGKPEVVVGIQTVVESGAPVDRLYAWHHDGTTVAGWPIRYAPGFVTTVFGFGAPVLADIDGDGKADVVVTSDATGPAYALQAYHGDATVVAGFPKPTASAGFLATNTVAVADLNGDGHLEIAWSDRYTSPAWGGPLSKLVAWDVTALKSSTVVWPMFHHDAQHTGVAPAATTVATQVNCGGPAVAPFVADKDFSGGSTIRHANTIDLSGVSNPAPMAVYQTARVGNFTYTFPSFAAGSSHTVRLHFAETFFSTAGSRVFDVTLNGTKVLRSFDIFKTAGAKNKAVIEQFTTAATSTGKYVIQFTSDVNQSLVSGIEID
jgi:subtilisin family serine protease